eukprot:3024432-Alexandrium_andersonii.AAC.1
MAGGRRWSSSNSPRPLQSHARCRPAHAASRGVWVRALLTQYGASGLPASNPGSAAAAPFCP